MTRNTADIVICGAGIAGITTAYHLVTKYQLTDIILVDPEPPLTVTSDKSFEGYRNWWPGPDDAMVALTNRSIDILEAMHREQPDVLHLNRGGYLYATANPLKIEQMIASAQESSNLGAGPLRIHQGAGDEVGYTPVSEHALFDAPSGADILLDQTLIRKHFPYLTENVRALLHARRCGWFSARQFGMHMLEIVRSRGVQLRSGEVIDIDYSGGSVKAIRLKTKAGQTTLSTQNFVNAAGPGQKKVGRMMGVELPVRHELHMKVGFNDQKQLVSRQMPLLIWLDPITIPWEVEEQAFLAEDESLSWLLEELPAGIHARPEGKGASNIVLMQWHYRQQPDQPTFPLSVDPEYPEFVLRGLATVLPDLAAYIDRMPKPYVDGGYYIRTPENRPIVGPIPGLSGAYILGGLGGSGLQTAPAAGELLADHIAGAQLPPYAPAFLLERYDDPAYQNLLAQWGPSGQI